jgi:nicotinamidase-related amidase
MLMAAEAAQVLLVDVQERLLPAMANAEEVAANAALVLHAAQALGVPVTVSEQYPQGLGPTVPALRQAAGGDEPFAKIEFSCLKNAAIAERLRGLGRRQLVVAGVEAHVCVLQSVIDARDEGFEVFVVADATGSRKPESRERALARMAAAGAQVVTAEMAVFEWLERADSPRFRELSKLVR